MKRIFLASWQSAADWTQKDSFCPAPWTHSHLDAHGTRRLCCVAQDAPAEIAQADFATYWNSPYMKSIRRKMMSGELPEECYNCKVPNKVDTYKEGLKINFRWHFRKIRKATSPDGESKYPLLFLDYRTNTCNLSCKFCGPESSSSWMKLALNETAEWQAVVQKDYAQGLQEKIKRSPYNTEFLELVKTNPIEKIYFAGGEPLLSPVHFKVLDFLIESGRSHRVFLCYNTNLTAPTSIITQWLEKLQHFKKVEVYCSVDGTKDITEYIRTGMKFDLFNFHLDLLKNHREKNRNFYFNLDATMTSLFMLDLKGFSDFAIQKQIPVDAKLMLGYESRAGFLRCEVLPKRIRERLIDDWIQYYNTLNIKDSHLLLKMRENLELVKNIPEFPDEMKRKSFYQAQLNDKAFKPHIKFEDFLERDQDVEKWWKSLAYEN